MTVSRDVLVANLAGFQRRAAERPDLTPASVALCTDGTTLLITRRARGLRAHAGQWALPGGRRDPGESIEDAARRELAEETGLRVGPDSVLGRLDDYVTRSGYVMSPVVLWTPDPAGPLAGPASEVARVHRVPIADFDVEPEFVTIPESDRPVIRLPLFGRHLHAPTAAVVYQFCAVAVHGRAVRVAHYEAPVFAWE